MLAEISLRAFRNLHDFDWRPGPGRHLILGPNGAGKTSLMEAVYLLATTRSFRGAGAADCCRHGERSFHLGGEAVATARVALEVGWSAEGGRYRRVNGRTGSLAEHLEALPVVAWTADQGELLGGPPAVRRRFVDQGVVGIQARALEEFGRYRRALQQKRRLLARGGAEVDPWNRVLAAAAAGIAAARGGYLERLEAALGSVLEECELELPAVGLRYRPSPAGAERGEEAVLAALEKAAGEERRKGRPLVGPHRDEIEILWGGKGARRVASAGERKILALALLAARGRILAGLGRPPVYLLDDLDSELDRDRLEAARRLFAPARQVFVSSNRPELWSDDREASRWHLREGLTVPGEGSPESPES